MAKTAAGKARRGERNVDKLIAFLLDRHCEDCGEDDILVLEFDHVRGVKTGEVNEMVKRGVAWDTILREIKLCDVICSNCHRRRTAIRGNFMRWRKCKDLHATMQRVEKIRRKEPSNLPL